MSDATRARLLVFRVGTLVCAAEVDQVREILPRLPTTRIPGAPPVVAGLVNVRGRLVTVVDGWRALRQDAPATNGGAGATLVLSLGRAPDPAAADEEADRLIGFTVDEVMDMLTVAGDVTVEDRESDGGGGGGGLAGVDPTMVRAVGRRPGQLFIVLDIGALLGPILSQGKGPQ